VDDRELTSLVVLFQREDSATDYFKAILSRPFPAEIERSVPALGEEAIGLRGRLRRGGALRTSFMWRRGSLFLFVNAIGPFEYREVLPLAVEMDQSARDMKV
jgi:hypothetical protein